MMPAERLFLSDDLAPHAGGSLAVTPRTFTRWDELREHLLSLTVREGWVCTVDAVSRFRHGALDFQVLSAELVLDEARSVHVRRSGDRWVVTALTERPDGDMAAYDEEHLGVIEGTRPAYRVWWRQETRDGVPVWTPYAARLTRFEEKVG